jgi:hypothetical protein
MSTQWSMEFAASQPENVYLGWLRQEPGFVGPIAQRDHPEFRIGSLFVSLKPSAEDPVWIDDFEEMYGFRQTHKLYFSKATREYIVFDWQVLAIAMRFLRDFSDDVVLDAHGSPYFIRKGGILAVAQKLFATSPEWAAFLKPPHWFGSVEDL